MSTNTLCNNDLFTMLTSNNLWMLEDMNIFRIWVGRHRWKLQIKPKLMCDEAKMKGEVGAKLREGQIRCENAAKIDAETKIIAERGKKEEMKVKAEVKIFENQRDARVAEEVESVKAVAIKEAELQRQVELKNALTQTKKFKADILVKLVWNMMSRCKRQGELKKPGMVASFEAQGVYVGTLVKSFNSNYASLRDYLMIDGGMYQQIALSNVGAVKGLQPKISIWTNGDGSSLELMVSQDYIRRCQICLDVEQQTGMTPPAWLGTSSSTPH
ncbi:hypothetical protein MKW92_005956 [Papaver armeniacum]|nr:hypothetical protein MKW92_005956 [Papaver armeniacum]